MADHSHQFKIGASHYQIDFEGNKIWFYHIGKKGPRRIGEVFIKFPDKNSKRAVLFSASISHPSIRVAEELAEVAEGIFREHHPNIGIEGHRTLFQPKKPPQSRSHRDPKPSFPRRKTGLPKRQPFRPR